MNVLDLRELESRHTTARMRFAILSIYRQCIFCGSTRALSCHHWWFPYRSCKDFSCAVSIANIVGVCRACHNRLHTMPLDKARAKVMPYVAVKLRTAPQDLRAILEGHCSCRHVLDFLITEL